MQITREIYQTTKQLLKHDNSHAWIADHLGIGKRTVARISSSSSFKNYKEKIQKEIAERKVNADRKAFSHSHGGIAYEPTDNRSRFFSRLKSKLVRSKAH